MALNTITTDIVKNIFITKSLVDLSKQQSILTTPTKIKPNKIEDTPMTKLILSTMSPGSQSRMRDQIMIDNDRINRSATDALDTDFFPEFDNKELGHQIENYLSINAKCPVCGKKTLKRFLHSNVPVIDLVCTNTEFHLNTNTTRFYQVKLSTTNYYFNLHNKYISIGSRKYAEPILSMLDTNVDAAYVPGYICIKLIPTTSMANTTYIIDKRNSFCVVPNTYEQLNQPFYYFRTEKNRFGADIIEWSELNTIMIDLTTIVSDNRIDNFPFYTESVIDNPYNNPNNNQYKNSAI